MKMRTQFIVLLSLACALISCEKDAIENAVISETENIVIIELQILNLVNDHRMSIGKSNLTHSDVAYTQANSHTEYMISKGSLSHDNFNNRASRITSETEAKEIGENVAKGHLTANAVFNAWINSPNHKSNIEGDYTHTAVSVKEDANGNLYFTQIFFK